MPRKDATGFMNPLARKSVNPLSALRSVFCIHLSAFLFLTLSIVFQASGAADSSYKIPVDKDGLYAITPDLLRESGAEVEQIVPRSFRMTSKGREIPIYVSGEQDGRFDGWDYIQFYGQKHNAGEYTETNIYWLSWNLEPGARMVEEDVSLLQSRGQYETPEQGYRQKVRFEIDNGRFQRYTRSDEIVWFWMRLNAPGLSQIPFDLRHVSDSLENGSVRVMLHGSVNTRHDMEVFLNAGFRLGDLSWFGQESYLLEADDVPNSVFVDGKNATGIYYQPGGSQDKAEQVLLDWIEVEYWRDYKADNDVLEFSNPQNQGYGVYQFEIEGFSSPDIELFKLSSDVVVHGVSKLTGGHVEDKGGKYNLIFQDNIVQPTRYIAMARDRLKFPAEIERDDASELRSANQGADYIVITHEDFYDSAIALSEFRAAQGMRTVVVDVEDVYDEFSYGIFDPRAIRDFIDYAFHNWQKPAPGYVVLLGDASWWYKRDESYVPSYTYNSKVGDPGSEWGPTASDDYFVLVSGDDPIPDLCVGRIPAKTEAEARIAANKIIDYETSPEPGDWRKSLLFLSGRQPREPRFIFDMKAEEFIDRYVPPGYSVSRLYTNPDSPYHGSTSELLNAINEGHSFIRFAGHGGGSVWSDDDLLSLEDIPLLENGDRLPFIMSWTCFTAWFDNPYTNCLGEDLLFLDGGGAIALLGSTGLGLLYADLHLEEEMYKVIFEKNERILGRAVTEAKMAFLTKYAGRRDYMDLAATYTLIGDPATKLALPQMGPPGAALPDLVISASDIQVDETQDPRLKTRDSRLRTQDSGLKTQDMRQEDSSFGFGIPVSYTISVPVHNTGRADAHDVMVKLYDGNPFQIGGAEVGSRMIASIASGRTSTISFTWTSDKEPGNMGVVTQDSGSGMSRVLSPGSCVFVWVDPSDEIQEESESNNVAQLQVRTNMFLATPEAGSNGPRGSADGVFFCSIPGGSLLSETYLTIEQVDGSLLRDTQPDVRHAPLSGRNGAAYEIQLSRDAAIVEGESIEIYFEYDPAGLTESEKEKLAIYRRLEAVERWVICDDCTAGEGTVSARVQQLGLYALMVNNDTTTPEINITLKDQGFIQEDFVSSSPQVSVVAEDANGIREVKVFLDGTVVPPEELSVSGAMGMTPFPVEYHPALRRGEHVVEVEVHDLNGLSATDSITIAVEPEFRIEDTANRPNPCRRRTLFTYVLTQPADDMTIRIYSASGRRIMKLEAPASAGYNEILWDLRDEDGRAIANGVYFYKLTARREGKKAEEIGKLAVIK